MKSRLVERVMRASVIIITAHILFKVAGLLQSMVIGHFYSAAEIDAFVMGFEGVIFLLFLIGEESIGPAFLPVFLGEINKGSEGDAWRFANGVLTVHTVLLAALSLIHI